MLPNCLTLQILMAIHVHPQPEAQERIRETCWNSPAGVDARKWLRDNGLILHSEADTTARGRAFIDSLLAAPLPIEETRWVIPKPRADRDFTAMYRDWPE